MTTVLKRHPSERGSSYRNEKAKPSRKTLRPLNSRKTRANSYWFQSVACDEPSPCGAVDKWHRLSGSLQILGDRRESAIIRVLVMITLMLHRVHRTCHLLSLTAWRPFAVPFVCSSTHLKGENILLPVATELT